MKKFIIIIAFLTLIGGLFNVRFGDLFYEESNSISNLRVLKHSIVPYDSIIKYNYSIGTYICDSTNNEVNCFLDNYNREAFLEWNNPANGTGFFDDDGNIRKKHITYFINTGLNFDITEKEWYKNINNIRELINKTKLVMFIDNNPTTKNIRLNKSNFENVDDEKERIIENWFYDYLGKIINR